MLRSLRVLGWASWFQGPADGPELLMFVVGLTGGVGAGKSTVAALLSDAGAVVIDADTIARQVLEPGTAGFDAVVTRFGQDYLRDDGTLDRQALGQLVFSDPESLTDLNAIVHPGVREEFTRRLNGYRQTDKVVVIVIPLLIESGHYATDFVITVDCEEDEAVRRVVSSRGWSENHARSRIASQVTREARRAAADEVINNTGNASDLPDEVKRVWAEVQRNANASTG